MAPNSPSPTSSRATASGRGTLYCAAAMLLLGASVSVTPALRDYPVLMGQMWRYLVGGLALLAAARVLRSPLPRPTWRELGWLVLVAAVGMAAFNVFLLLAVRESAPSVTASVVGCAPIVLALIAPAMTRQRPGRALLLGAVVVAAGVALGQGGGATTALGLVLSVAVMACEVGFTLLATPVLARLGAVAVATWASLLAVPLLFGGAVATGTVDLTVPTSSELAALAWMALVMTALAFGLWYSGVAVLGAPRASLLTGLLPLGAVVATAVLDPASLTLRIVLGAVVAGVGIVVGSGGLRGRGRAVSPAAPVSHQPG